MLLEVIATTVSEANQASEYGADRIELITGMAEGGLTPSLGLIEEVTNTVEIPVYVMVRPHSHSFCYDSLDVQTMLSDIVHIRKTKASGIVVGALTNEKTIDVDVTQKLLDAAGSLRVTFHRAFDEVRDQIEALHTLLATNRIERVLTSGGKSSVLNARNQIRHLLDVAKGTHLKVMAGAGLTVDGLEEFIRQTGVEEVHFGKAIRVDGNPNLPIDRAAVESVKRTFARVQASELTRE